MAQVVKLKRSSIPGKVPTAESMDTGELAMNATDGKLFLKDISFVRPIVTTGVGTFIPRITGSLLISGNFDLEGTFTAEEGIISSGSNIFGDASDDIHEFKGDVYISESGLIEVDTFSPRKNLGNNSFIQWGGDNVGGEDFITLKTIVSGTTAIEINEGPSNSSGRNIIFNPNSENFDFIVNGENEEFLINADASTDRIGIGLENPSARLHVNTNISSSALQTSTLTSLTHIQTPYISSSNNLVVTSSNSLTMGANNDIVMVPKGNTTPITINHPLSSVGNTRAVVTYKNDEKALQYHSEKYLLSQSNNLGVYKGVGMATISASIGSAFTQDVADFASSFVAVHMNYNAVGVQGGYVETGEFYIAYNQTGNSYNHQPKVLLAKNTSQTILELTSSGYCNVSAQINSSFGPVEIMYEYTAFTQGII